MLAAGVLSGAAAARRIEASAAAHVVPGEVVAGGVVTTDAMPADDLWVMLMRVETIAGSGFIPAGAVVAVETLEPAGVAGDTVRVRGALRDRPGRLRADPYRALVRDAGVDQIDAASGLFGVGNALRGYLLGRLAPYLERPEGALLSGFLVGDTTQLTQGDLDNLRSSGLTHYVAVSGSNVALFLGAWWLVVGPLRFDPRLRAATGLLALGVFVVATRWEASVVRAAAMAAVVLCGSIAGVRIEPWRALGVAVTGLLLFAGDLAVDVGFQLSAGATAGVLVAMRIPVTRQPRWVWSIVHATVGAQLAVLPVLLFTFGTVPMFSPVANVIAAPLVTLATVLGGAGLVTGLDPLIEAGLLAARGVLVLADHAGGWPQLGAVGAGFTVAGVVALRARRTRGPAVAGMAAWLLVASVPVPLPDVAQVVFLDVGQGDAILITDGAGSVALVDGGRDPDVLLAALARHGITHIDLLIATHGDVDHVGGLPQVVASFEVEEFWHPRLQPQSPALDDLTAAAARSGARVTAAGSGDIAQLGPVHLQVLSPSRRFAGDNDGSVVLWVAAGGVSVLLTGDIEAVGQAELPELHPDILHVPHHGSATTDLDWLTRTVGDIAVVSVGANTYGHPSPLVLDLLRSRSAAVYVTQEHGDVVIPLAP